MVNMRCKALAKSLRFFFFAILGLGGAALGVELILRYSYGFGDPLLYASDTYVEYISKPNQDVRRFGNRITTNSYGIRSDPLTENPAPGRRRILVLGDSIVFGGVLVDQQALATTLLQKELRSQGVQVDVSNVSAGSWGPGNWKGWAASRGFLGATDIVLVLSSGDAYDNPTFAALNPVEQPTRKPASALQGFSGKYLNPSRLQYQLAAWGLIQPAPSLEPEPGREGAIQQGLSDLRAFLTAAKRSGARVAVVQHWERGELPDSPQPEHQRILELLEQMNIPVVQDRDFLLKCSADPGQELYIDSIHLNTVKGQACLAKALQQALNLR